MAETAPRPGSWPAVDAATILLVRDGADGLEVFLQERHLDSDFVGGAYVFPGGKVDPADRDLDPERWSGVWLPRAADLIGCDTEDEALGILVAAVRETFEEGGVLLATRAGAPIDAATLASPSFRTARQRLASREERFDWRPWLAEEDLVLDLGALGFWSWWVTPDGEHKRYDTRFFAAAVPAGQADALGHDDVEMTDSRWMRPGQALDRAAAGEVRIVFPTRKNLEALAAYATTEDVLRACAMGTVDQRRIKPVALVRDGRVLVRISADAEPEPF